VTSSHRTSRRRQIDGTTPSVAPAAETAAPAAPVPLAGLARAVEGATTDVVGGETVPDGVQEALRRRSGGGSALPRRTAQELGASLGTDLSGVRVHADGEADTIARSVQAKAFTLGTDVYFSRGTYSPDSREGRSLLAHELTHVRQHQHGGAGGSGGLRVGRVDDPAEREAEQVARQVVEGRPVTPATGGETGAVRRSADPTIRRLFGLFGTTQVANIREGGDIGSEDEGLPLEFIDLADTLQAIPQLKDAEGLKFDGKAFDSATTFAGSEAMKGFGGTMSLLGGAKEMVGGALEGKDAIENLYHGYRGYDFGLGATPGAKADSLSKNLGAVQAESAVTSLFTGGLGITSGGSSLAGMSELAGEQIPFLDVAVNGVQGTLKTKKAIEDSVASGKLGRQRTHVKREQDQFLPFELRAKRFGDFVVALRDGGRVKGDDRKRWTKVHGEWIAHVATLPVDKQAVYDLTAPDASATAKKKPKPPTGGQTGGQAGGQTGGQAPATTFHPLRSDWANVSVQKEEKKAFLDFLQAKGFKDFGYGTDLRKDYEKGLKGPDGKRTESTDAGYEQMRDLGKVASFGQRRKAETATVNSVEAVGHFADAAGTFTAGGDMGATKATGKAIKAASALYKSVKTLIKRGRRVHKLRQAKNQMEYGGKGGRGVLWGAKQFFVGNVDSQQKKARGALNSAVKKGDEHEKAHASVTRVWQDAKDLYDAYLLDKADHDEYLAFCKKNGADLSEALVLWPVPDVVADPGAAPVQAPAPTTGQKAPGTKTAKVMSAEDAKPLIKMLTIQCKRKIDDLIACLLSENETVRKRAKRILHIVAETNLAGGIQKIDDQDLDLLFEVHKKLRDDATYGSNVKHQAEFKRRKGVIKDIVSGQLEGIGG
jgi:hypothetical protein